MEQAWVVQRMDNAIHRINHYPVDSVVCFVNTYPLDSDLSSGWRYPAFENWGQAAPARELMHVQRSKPISEEF